MWADVDGLSRIMSDEEKSLCRARATTILTIEPSDLRFSINTYKPSRPLYFLRGINILLGHNKGADNSVSIAARGVCRSLRCENAAD